MGIVAVLAQMDQMEWHNGDHMGNGWWWVMGIGWLLILALIVVLIVTLVRQSAPRVPGPASRREDGSASAERILSERFARGEIDEDEYRRRRDALRG